MQIHAKLLIQYLIESLVSSLFLKIVFLFTTSVVLINHDKYDQATS